MELMSRGLGRAATIPAVPREGVLRKEEEEESEEGLLCIWMVFPASPSIDEKTEAEAGEAE
jgi:hypothetical protein